MTISENINWMHHSEGFCERIHACFSGRAYEKHSHDSYTIAVTTNGVQSFNYRGQLHHSLPGQVVLLHPGETHDGLAGTDKPFSYKAIEINPVDIQDVLQGATLPFIQQPVSNNTKLKTIASHLLDDIGSELDNLEYEDLLWEMTKTLQALSGTIDPTPKVNYQAIKRVREYIDDSIEDEISLDILAMIAGYSKWHLSRDFRALYGTSPYRYVITKRIRKAKQLILADHSLADVALACRFTDQSHLTRQFKKTIGTTPNIWKRYIHN